jgi:hypothetical protein
VIFVMGRAIAFAGVALVLAFAASACSGEDSGPAAAAPRPQAQARACPAAWRGGWQRLATRIDSAVYCPTWMPSPLDGRIGGQWDNGVSVRPDRSYLVSFLWHEPPAQDVHVNFRGYPGQTRMPRCEDDNAPAGTRRMIACFRDPKPTRRIGPYRITPYTVNEGVDQWHVVYLWRDRSSLYTVSQHVAKPLTYRQVVADLDRVVRGLVRIDLAA